MHVENEGLVAVISFYQYGLIGLSLLVVISPLIIVEVPLLVVLGPVGFAWWRSRRKSPRVGAAARWWLATTSIAVLALPVVPALWFMIANERRSTGELLADPRGGWSSSIHVRRNRLRDAMARAQ